MSDIRIPASNDPHDLTLEEFAAVDHAAHSDDAFRYRATLALVQRVKRDAYDEGLRDR